MSYAIATQPHTRSAAQVTSVRLIRLPSLTHIVDANMRSVELPFTRHGEEGAHAPPHRLRRPGCYRPLETSRAQRPGGPS